MKEVLYVNSEFQNRPPRIGQTIKIYHRNVTKMARIKYGTSVKQAYQFICYSYKEDSYKDIHNKIQYELSKLPIDYLYPHDNEVIVFYDDNKIIKYDYYDGDYTIIKSFDPGKRLQKW